MSTDPSKGQVLNKEYEIQTGAIAADVHGDSFLNTGCRITGENLNQLCYI